MGALNIDGCRVPGESTLVKRPPNSFGRINDDGWEPKEGFNGSDLGRWPANVIHDGSNEVISQFPVQKSGGTPSSRKADKFRNTFGAFKGGTVKTGIGASEGSASRFFYCAKASRTDRDDGLSHLPQQEAGIKNASGRGFSETDPNRPVMRANTHPTVKPTDLMRYLCRLVTPPGGTVLDPFMGSGSTGRGAVLEGFNFIGCELDADYTAIARARIAAVTPALAEGVFA